MKSIIREEAWWKSKRLKTSADSWEDLVAEHCGFEWQEEEEGEKEVEEEEKKKEEREELTLSEGGLGLAESVIIKKEAMSLNDEKTEESTSTPEDANLDELVSNDSSKDCLTELEVKDGEGPTKDFGQVEPREDLLKPVPHHLATPAAVTTGLTPVPLSQTVNADLYICYKCKKSLKSARQLQTHQAFQHESVEEEEIKCMVMKCGKMFRKTSTLENHMRGHQETGAGGAPSQNFPPNLFGPVLLQKKPKLTGLRFPLQQIQNQDSQSTQSNRNQKNLPQKPNLHHLESKAPTMEQASPFIPYFFNKMPENTHASLFERSSQRDFKMDINDHQGLRF